MKLEFSYDVWVWGGGGGGYAKKPKHFQKHEGREVKKDNHKNRIKEGPQKNSNRLQMVLF